MNKIILLLFICSGLLYAQENVSLPLLDIKNQKYDTSMEKLYQTRSIIRTTVPQVLESEIDEEEYLIGPGDIFKVSIFGELENEFEFTVLPAGTVLIPTVGELQISGLNLKQVKHKLQEKIKDSYIRADVSVNLTGLRKFRVYYTGEVKAPGTYFAQGSDRLSDILEISMVEAKSGFIKEGEEQYISFATSINDWGDDTQIQVRHKDNSVDVYDISRFYRLGDKSQNPYLRGGDIIYVPAIDLTQSYVIIEGNVGFQGVYSIKPGENLNSFLSRVSALSKKSELRNIIVERGNTKNKIDLLDNPEKYSDFYLENKDKIIIPTIYDKVYVQGEVLKPGAFPYKANYTALDYVGEAGVLDSADDPDNIIIIRKATGEVLQGKLVIIEKGDTLVLPKRSREVIKDYATIFVPILSIGISAYILITR